MERNPRGFLRGIEILILVEILEKKIDGDTTRVITEYFHGEFIEADLEVMNLVSSF